MKRKRKNTYEARLRLLGILHTGCFPSVYDGTAAAFTWSVAACDGGHALGDLALLMNKTDPGNVRVTLARRDHWRKVAHEVAYPELVERLDLRDEGLLFLVAHNDRDGEQVFTLDEMKEALSG